MKKIIYCATLFFILFTIKAQSKFNPNIDKDSLFKKILTDYPEDNSKIVFEKAFAEGTEDTKEYLIVYLLNSHYDKDSLINNFEINQEYFPRIISDFSKIVPKNFRVQVSFFNSEIAIPKSSISITIYKIKDGSVPEKLLYDRENLEFISNNKGLQYGSEKLSKILTSLNWTENNLRRIETDLKQINCISIRNGDPFLFQFKRAGLGVLSYKIFNENLNQSRIFENNDGCNSVFYKNNVVLVSDNGEDGAKGALCFPN